MRTLKIIGTVILSAVTAMAQESKTVAAGDVLSVLQARKSLTSFDTALRLSGVNQTLRGAGPFTVIAPSDGAFTTLSKDDLRKLMTTPIAMHVLLEHYVVRGKFASNDSAGLSSARTLMGVVLRSESHNGELRINGAKIVDGDIRCANGVVQIVDYLDPGLVREALAMAGTGKSLAAQSQLPVNKTK